MYGKMISSLRKQRKMSQSELGERLGIGVSSVSMWEAEKRQPSIENLLMIMDIFDVSADYILSGKVDDKKLSKDERELVDLYSQLSDKKKAEVKGIIKGLLMSE